MAEVMLSLDIGTGKIAGVAFDCAARRALCVVSAANSATVPGVPAGCHEQDPEKIFAICMGLLQRLLAEGGIQPGDAVGVAISGQMHGVLLVDESNRLLCNLMTWCDQRAAGLVAEFDPEAWPSGRTGCRIHPGYGGATLAYLARNGELPAGAQALTIADFVAARLCGTVATEPTHAASWGIMDVHENRWDEEALGMLGLSPEVLPEIRPALSCLGTVLPETGLPCGMKVYSPLGDNQAGFIGTCGLDGDMPLLNLGTGGQISVPCRAFRYSPELETRPLPFSGYLLVGASLCGGRAYGLLKDFFRETVREFTGQDMDDAGLYAVMDRLATGTEAEGPTVDTRFAGTRLEPVRRGSIAGIGTDNFHPGAWCRGFTKGMVAELADMMPKELLAGFRKIMAGGNAVRRNPLIPPLIFEILGLECGFTETREEAATGAALAAAKSAGLL